jgi:hypothetical protein
LVCGHGVSYLYASYWTPLYLHKKGKQVVCVISIWQWRPSIKKRTCAVRLLPDLNTLIAFIKEVRFPHFLITSFFVLLFFLAGLQHTYHCQPSPSWNS